MNMFLLNLFLLNNTQQSVRNYKIYWVEDGPSQHSSAPMTILNNIQCCRKQQYGHYNYYLNAILNGIR